MRGEMDHAAHGRTTNLPWSQALLVAAISLCANGSLGLDNGMGLQPPMGFNDWNEIARHYEPWARGVNETTLLGVAQALVETGLRDKGYSFINLDCGYSTGASNSGKPLQIDPKKFPSGMAALGDKLHGMQLRFGIYSSGSQCCDKNVRVGMEREDAKTFAGWGIDYVKYDDCGTDLASFKALRDALNATGRNMLLSIHSPWTHHPSSHGKDPGPASSAALANIWRTTNDITNDWAAVLDRAHENNAYAPLAGPGHFNDPDMLEVGNGLSDAEGRSHFSLWALMKAPLLIGTDLTRASPATLATLGNADAIAVNQDRLGVQGRLLRSDTHKGGWELWGGPLAGSCWSALLINLGDSALRLNISLSDLGIAAGLRVDAHDIWANRTLARGIAETLPLVVDGAHDCSFLKLCRTRGLA